MQFKTKLNVCRFIQKGQEIFSDYNYALEVCWILLFFFFVQTPVIRPLLDLIVYEHEIIPNFEFKDLL